MYNEIGIIVTFYNHKKYIFHCLENLKKLKLIYPQLNIYVVNSGSTDFNSSEYKKFVKTFNSLNIVRTENLGSSGSKNYGVGLSREPLITFLDGDDLLDEKRITLGAPIIKQNQYDLVIGNQKFFFEKEVDISKIKTQITSSQNLHRPYLNSMIVRKETFSYVGFFDTKYKIAGDLDWYLRAKRKKVRILITKQDFVLRRVRLDNPSFNYEESFKERNKVLLEHKRELANAKD